MKLSTYLLGPALAQFFLSPLLGMEIKSNEMLLDRQPESIAGPSRSFLKKIPVPNSIKGLLPSKKKKDAVETLGSVALKEFCKTPQYKKANKEEGLRKWATDATKIISKGDPLDIKVEDWTSVFEDGLQLWIQLWRRRVDDARDELTILGFLEGLLDAIPMNNYDSLRLVGKLPDELMLTLKAVKEYPTWFASSLRAKYTESETTKTPFEVTECWDRAELIGRHQQSLKEQAPGQAARKIDEIVKLYLMEAQLPQEEKQIERMISLIRRNLRRVSYDSLEGNYSAEVLFHLFQYPSAVKTRLSELEDKREFWKDVYQPFIKAQLSISSSQEPPSPIFDREVRRVMNLQSQSSQAGIKVQSQPSDEDLRSLINQMQSFTESKDMDKAQQIYKLLSIQALHSDELEKKIYDLIFFQDHVPPYMVALWSKLYPNLATKKNLLFFFQKMMIKRNFNYFSDAKRSMLAQSMEKVDGEWYSSLITTLNSLKANQKQNINADSTERISRQIFDSMQYSGPNDIRTYYALSLHALLRVMEYDNGSINSFLQCMNREERIRLSFYLSAKHLIDKMQPEVNLCLFSNPEYSVRIHCNRDSTPQLPGFLKALILAIDELWPEKLPTKRVGKNWQITEESKDDRSEKFRKVTEDLRKVVMENEYF
ncbi:hypothetical protein DFH28DRAFT_949719 [Melampsora americana]|nr:hypothetical protein DFH28DRAFT_949719 [Melampsora americana]